MARIREYFIAAVAIVLSSWIGQIMVLSDWSYPVRVIAAIPPFIGAVWAITMAHQSGQRKAEAKETDHDKEEHGV